MELKKTENEISELVTLYEDLRGKLMSVVDSCKDAGAIEGEEEQCGNDDPDYKGGTVVLSIPPSMEDIIILHDDVTNSISFELERGHLLQHISLDQWNQLQWSRTHILDGLQTLQPRMDRFQKKLADIDPITGNPRYGEHTQKRVQSILHTYNGLVAAQEQHLPPMEVLEQIIQQKKEEEALRQEQLQKEEQLKQLVQQQQQQLEEQLRIQEQFLQKQKEEEERRKLAELAEKSRLQRMGLEQQRQEEERQRLEKIQLEEQSWENSIPKGSMNQQLEILRASTTVDGDYTIAIQSLHRLFQQILAKPEQVSFRKIRRDHPQFTKDIGRHAGGKEFLISAGFHLSDDEDNIPCFLSKEPDLENDMDAWSDWYSNIKSVVEILEQELEGIKKKKTKK
mmetsp:Transcript_13828/g.19811  ORF Transcript_13828/g.19811 Transcript_13828/m.19811 type:complete len:395 (-) Transcript_13828:52-1236(-)